LETSSGEMDPGSAAHHFVLRSIRGTQASYRVGTGFSPR
jgi:hypothetical protein